MYVMNVNVKINLLAGAIFFSLSVSAQSMQERANSLINQSSQQINKAVENSREQINRSVESTRESATRNYNSTRESVKKEINNQANNSNSYYNKTKDSYDRAIKNISNNVNATTRDATNSLKTTLYNTAQNGYEISRYEAQSNDMVTNMTIAAFKNVPIYDAENNRLVSMDTYCRDMIKQMGGSKSDGDFGKDPVATSCMILMDQDYMFHAKIIQTSDNQWISINEAAHAGTLPSSIEQEYKSTRNAFYSNNASEFQGSLNELIQSVNSYNAEVQTNSAYRYSNKKMQVSGAKAYFHNSPELATRRKAYCIKDDVVDVLDQQGNWVFVRFNGPKISSVGWMQKSDLYSL
jgi:hypothetical protein